jgi:hypothetical protein
VTAISNLAQAAILKIIAQATGATLKWRFDAAVHECRGCPVRAEGNECGLATAAREPPESLRPVDARYGSIWRTAPVAAIRGRQPRLVA